MNTFAGIDMAVNPMATIDQMPAGREIDRLVAERVMSWEAVEPYCYTPYGKDSCGTNPDHKGGWDGYGRMAIPFYSTDIRAAWEVANHIISEEGHLDLWCTGRKNTFYKAVSGMVIAVAETAPLAICRAALKLVMGAKQE